MICRKIWHDNRIRLIASLSDYKRGQLNGTNSGISTLSLDQDDTGDGSTAWTYETARTHNNANEITAITATTGGAWSDPAYDAAGNTTKTPAPDDPATATSDRQMVYDAWDRLFCVASSTTTNPNGPDILADYQYDARHFKISKGGYSGRSNIERTHYYYTSSWQCIEETKQVAQSGWTPAEIVLLPAELSAQYVWGLRYVDDLIQRQRDTTGNATLDETLYALNDRQFNVAALTNTSGAVQQRFVTTPYGQTDYLTAAYASSTDLYDWQFVFQGLRKDPDTPFIYNRMRDTDTLLGRFLQTEPLGYTDGMNRYAAYHVMWGGVDPTGKSAGMAAGAMVAATAGTDTLLRRMPSTPRKSIEVDVAIYIWKKRKLFENLSLADFAETFILSCDSEGKVILDDIQGKPRIVNKWQEIRASLDMKTQGDIGIQHTGKHTATIEWKDNQIIQGTEFFNAWLGTLGLIVSAAAHKTNHPKIALASLVIGAINWIGSQLDDIYFYQVDAFWKAECECIEEDGKEEWWAIYITEDRPMITDINSNVEIGSKVLTYVD